MGIALRQASSGALLAGTVAGQTLVWNETEQEWDVSTGIFTRSSPVFVEDYLPAAGNDLRTAIKLAWAANPQTGAEFWLPPGSWPWVGGPLLLSDGFRNSITIRLQNTRIYKDLAGVAGGTEAFFERDESDSTHADNITFCGTGSMELLNVNTSFFSSAVLIECASNCTVRDIAAIATLAVGVTAGKIRWGFALLGDPNAGGTAGGRNNKFLNVKLQLAQIRACSGGRSCNGVLIDGPQVISANDLAISCVSTGSTSVMENVKITNVQVFNVAGAGVILAGTDGSGTGFGAGVVRNFSIDGVQQAGEREPNTTFDFAGTIQFNGGLVTENVTIENIQTKLAPNASAIAFSVSVVSQDDETSWQGLECNDLNLGVVTSNDPLEALVILGVGMTGVTVDNVKVRGLRGVKIQDCDQLSVSHVEINDGTLQIQAKTRNLTGITLSDCVIRRPTGFVSCLRFFNVSAARNMTGVMLSNVYLDSAIAGLQTSLGGGTMQMMIENVNNVSNSNPTAETLTGIIRSVNLKGFVVLTTVSVVVPAVLVGQVGYVDVAMTGTRLADLAVGEPVLANPTADLVAAGAGGAFCNARVSATGTVRCAFVGPLAGGASNFDFARAA